MSRLTPILYPEWQGCGNPSVHAGALALADALFAGQETIIVDAPAEEAIRKETGVTGLGSIAPRFQSALRLLREAAPAGLFLVGGTCGTEAAPVGYLNERCDGDLAVVWLDAHGDLNTPASSPSGKFHGMVLRTLLGDGPGEIVGEFRRPLVPSQVFLAGVRDLDPGERDFIQGNDVFMTQTVDAASGMGLANRIQAAGLGAIYIHMDVDVINPDGFHGALMPTAGGPSLASLGGFLAALVTTRAVVGMSLVEFSGTSAIECQPLVQLVRQCGLNPVPA